MTRTCGARTRVRRVGGRHGRGFNLLSGSITGELCGRSLICIWGKKAVHGETADSTRFSHREMLGRAMQTVRQAVLTMPAKEEIGDDAFHRIEEESDRLEIAKR